MTAIDYIREKFRAFGITESEILDMAIDCGLVLTDDVSAENIQQIGVAMVHGLEELLFAPRQNSVNESGFSVNWDFGELSKYYMWLCRKYGIAISDETKEALGLSMIIDRSNTW